MSKRKLLYYEVHMADLEPNSISNNYQLVSTSNVGNPWLKAFLVPNDTIINSEFIYYVISKHFRSVKTMFKWFNKHGIKSGNYVKVVRTRTKIKYYNYSFTL